MKQYRVFFCLLLGLFASLLTTTMVNSLKENSERFPGPMDQLID